MSRSKYEPGEIVNSIDELWVRLLAGQSHYWGTRVWNSASLVCQQFRVLALAVKRGAIKECVLKPVERKRPDGPSKQRA